MTVDSVGKGNEQDHSNSKKRKGRERAHRYICKCIERERYQEKCNIRVSCIYWVCVQSGIFLTLLGNRISFRFFSFLFISGNECLDKSNVYSVVWVSVTIQRKSRTMAHSELKPILPSQSHFYLTFTWVMCARSRNRRISIDTLDSVNSPEISFIS